MGKPLKSAGQRAPHRYSNRTSAVPGRGERRRERESSANGENALKDNAMSPPTDYEGETTPTLKRLRQQLQGAKTIGEMDEVRAQFDKLADEAAERGDSSQQAIWEEATNGIRRVIYQQIGKRNGMDEAAIRELQQKHEAAIMADRMMRRTAKYLSTADDSEIEVFNARMRRVLEDVAPKTGWFARHWNALKTKITHAKEK
jgi:hypothetical protein